MLVLTRQEGEALILKTSDGEILVSVEMITGRQVKIGIEAPESVMVLREKLMPATESS